MSSQKQKKTCLILALCVVTIVACQGQQAEVTEQWLPPYLRLQLHAGKAQVQWPDSSEWSTVEGKASVIVEEEIGIIADEVQGAQFLFGDGSTLELVPQASIKLQNLRASPRLHVVLEEGTLLFAAQEATYEFVVPACLVTILSVPADFSIKVDDEGTHLIVKEGVAACARDTDTITLPPGQEMHVASAIAEPEITEYTDTDATATVLALTPSPKPTKTPAFSPTATPSPTSTATPTPTRTRPPSTRPPVSSASPSPPPPTSSPTQPPASNPPSRTKPKPQPTDPPPPPPTDPPPPPPTDPPPPPPTDPPPPPTDPPQPTEAPDRPTPTP
jgi:hypothetical protein